MEDNKAIELLESNNNALKRGIHRLQELTEENKELHDLCKVWFLNPMVPVLQEEVYECKFCGAKGNSTGAAHHSASDCPYLKYKEI